MTTATKEQNEWFNPLSGNNIIIEIDNFVEIDETITAAGGYVEIATCRNTYKIVDTRVVERFAMGDVKIFEKQYRLGDGWSWIDERALITQNYKLIK
jgi:hypothetical protein